MSACKAPECARPATSKGYCGKHWERVKRHGDPTIELLIWGDPGRRFWSKVDKSGECWLWTGTLTYDGYGIFGVKGERTGAHRWAWRLAGREIPEGMHLDHLCRVRNCVRLDHLEVVTPAENNRRSASPTAANAQKSHCPRCDGEYSYDRNGGRYCQPCHSERRRQRKAEARGKA